jgi:hypothetical protein
MTTTIDQLITYFSNIKTEQIQAQMLENIKIVAELSRDEKNQLQLEMFLDNKHMIEFVGHKNSKYLTEFMNFLAKTDDMATKDKIIETIKAIL